MFVKNYYFTLKAYPQKQTNKQNLEKQKDRRIDEQTLTSKLVGSMQIEKETPSGVMKAASKNGRLLILNR